MGQLKIWLDDQRDASDWGPGAVENPTEWTRVNTVAELIAAVEIGNVSHVSLDYNLSHTDPGHTGMHALDYLADRVLAGKPIPVVSVHSGHTAHAGDMWKRVQALEAMPKEQP